MVETCHIPVLEKEVIEGLRAQEGGTFLDCTLGGGGHTWALLQAHPENRVCAIDRDARAIERVEEKLAHDKTDIGRRLMVRRGRFSDVEVLFAEKKFRGVLVDLGLSTDQLKENRGFSFWDAGPLDMRMDESDASTAAALIASSSESELRALLRRGGLGKEAGLAARVMVEARPFESAAALAKALNQAFAKRARPGKTNPSTVVFQALRIAVNDEFAELTKLLDAAPRVIDEQGRLAVISFHSLEDKIVTSRMRAWSGAEDAPALWPSATRRKPLGTLLTKKALVAGEEELQRNPSSRSARLRVFEFC